MFLTAEEQEMLAGGQGEAVRRAMEIVVALGEIFAAEDLVPVRTAQIAGVSYKNLGDAGLEFLQECTWLCARPRREWNCWRKKSKLKCCQPRS